MRKVNYLHSDVSRTLLTLSFHSSHKYSFRQCLPHHSLYHDYIASPERSPVGLKYDTDMNLFSTTCVCPKLHTRERLFSTKFQYYQVSNKYKHLGALRVSLPFNIPKLMVSIPRGKRKPISHLSKVLSCISCQSKGKRLCWR